MTAWPRCLFDHCLRTVTEYNEKVEYTHLFHQWPPFGMVKNASPGPQEWTSALVAWAERRKAVGR
jgi:hypothetical protein